MNSNQMAAASPLPLTISDRSHGWLRGIRKNLFSSYINSAITLLLAAILVFSIPSALDWLVFSATFSGEGRDACTGDGACWLVLTNRFDFFVYGFYPVDQRWRVDIAFLLGFLVFPMLFFQRIPKIYVAGYILLLPLILWLMLRGGFILDDVPSHAFGGFMLTFYLAAICMCLSLPVSILLALGRRSQLPVVRWLSVIYIEFIRSVPILTFLFMASIMAQLFLPSGMEVDKIVRVMVVMIIVSAAYKAEIIRGGIQGVPRGQIEASYALGVGYWKTMIYVVLPQALRNTVPPLINNFIGLVKETALVMIVGLLDLVGVGLSTLEDASWIGLDHEVYMGISLVFFVICFVISRYGIFLEKQIAKTKH